MVHSMDDIALVEVAPLQVLGMKKTGTPSRSLNS